MKLRKRKLFSSMAFVLSLVMLAVSGAVFVHTATQQSVLSSLQVTYEARNVSFTADAWYEKPSNSGTKQAFADNTLTVNATAAESTTSTLSVDSDIILNANPDTYVLFTYKFVNTASNGGYDMLVSLTDDATKTNVKVKYLTSITSNVYTTLSSQRTAVLSGGSTSVPAQVCVPAQSTLYYYVLVEIDDNTIGCSYTGDNDHTWTITSANTKGGTMYSVCFDANGGSGSMTSQSYTSGTQQALTTNSLTKEGYTFAGWSTTPNGSVVYTDEQALTLTSQSNGAQIVLYAVWEEEATVSFVGQNVNFSTQASYQVTLGGQTHQLENNGNTTVTVNATGSTASNSLAIIENDGDIELNSSYVVFQFVFTNLASSGGQDMQVALTDSTICDNITTKYAYSGDDSMDLFSTSTATPFNHETIGVGETRYFYIYFDRINTSITTTFTPSFTWNVTPVTTKNTLTFSNYQGESDGVYRCQVVYQYVGSMSEDHYLPISGYDGDPWYWDVLSNTGVSINSEGYLLLSTTKIGDGKGGTHTWTFYEGNSASGTLLGILEVYDDGGDYYYGITRTSGKEYLYIPASSSKNIYVVYTRS